MSINILLREFQSLNPFSVGVIQPYAANRLKLDLFLTVCFIASAAIYTGFSTDSFLKQPPNIDFSIERAPIANYDDPNYNSDPILSLFVTGPILGCTVTKNNFHAHGNNLTNPGRPPRETYTFVSFQDSPFPVPNPIQIPGIVIDIFAGIDTLGSNIVGYLSFPTNCPNITQTTYGISTIPKSTQLESTISIVRFNGFSYIQALPPNTQLAVVTLDLNSVLQITISLTKDIKLDGSIEYIPSFSPVAKISQPQSYPSTAYLISMNPDITVRKASRASTLVFLGSLGGAWSILFLLWKWIEKLLAIIFKLKNNGAATTDNNIAMGRI